MGVSATLPELSECTICLVFSKHQLETCLSLTAMFQNDEGSGF